MNRHLERRLGHRIVPTIGLAIIFFGTHAARAEEIVKGKLAGDIDQYLLSQEREGASGAFLVAKDGEIILSKGYGQADRKNNVPVTTDTVFDIGSITKQFTAAAILKLEMQGKLSVTDGIAKFFGNVPKDKSPITLHHLLTHTAGLRDAFGDDYARMTRKQIITKAMKTPLQFEPGTGYQYSNVGYSLLGAVVEIVSGQSYETYLHENLFKPAGMTQTGYQLPQWNPTHLAHGYKKNLFGAFKDDGTPLDHRWADDGPYWNLRANGGILSTVGDMYKWHLALEGDAVLSPEAKTKLFKPHVREEEGGPTYYCYGWLWVKTNWGSTLIVHNGGNGLFFASFRRYVDDGVVVISMTNCDEMFPPKKLRGILNTIFPQRK